MQALLYDGNTIYHYGKTDYISKVILKHKNWEPILTGLFNYLLKNKADNILFDIGCNIGYYSIISSKFCKKIYSFDANNNNLLLLQKSIKKNNINNIICYNSAVSSENDLIYILKTEDQNNRNIGGFKYIKNIGNNIVTSNNNIKSIKLDDFIKNNNIENIDLIKIDIEGGELECIRGLENTLNNNIIKKIIIEISPKFNQDSKEILQILINNDYLIYDIGLKEGGKYVYDESIYIKMLEKNIENIDLFLQDVLIQTNILAIKKI